MNNDDSLLRKYTPLLCWVVAVSACLCIAFKILGYGYVPVGDSRRYVAKAATEKEYPQILILGPTYHMDFSPGWGGMAAAAAAPRRKRLRGRADAIFDCRTVARHPLRRTSAFAISGGMAGSVAGYGDSVSRLDVAIHPGPAISCHRGRVDLAHARLGPRTDKISPGAENGRSRHWFCDGDMDSRDLVLIRIGPGRFFPGRMVAGDNLIDGMCWITGTALGAALTGTPIEFLKQNFLWGAALAREPVAASSLVGELQPSAGEFSALLLVGFVWLWRRQQPDGQKDLFRSPLFWLMAVSWILGLKAGRFWADWGLPAAMCWLAVQFDGAMKAWWENMPGRRLTCCCLLAAPLFLIDSSDLDSRYTRSLHEAFADGHQPEMQGWMPDDGGIFYSADFSFFFDTFYKNPDGNWRYMLGYEAAIMPDEDLRIYRNIQWNQNAWESYRPWVDKMRPQDRLEITDNVEPVLAPLEFHHAGGRIWIGRLPRKK